MIVTDLDGTFYNSKSELVQKNLDAVEYFKKNGGLFTVASGRVPPYYGRSGDSIPSIANTPAILCNGAFCYDFSTDKRLCQVELDYERAVNIINRVRESFPETNVRACFGDCEIAISPDQIFSCHRGKYRLSGKTPPEIFGWTRVSFTDESEVLSEIRRMVEEENSEYFSFMLACSTIFEFQAKEATKGHALDRLRSIVINRGLADENLKIYAIGDYENDLEMLRHCDVPACPENAIDLIKSTAKIHLCHCDDGTAADLISRIEAGEI